MREIVTLSVGTVCGGDFGDMTITFNVKNRTPDAVYGEIEQGQMVEPQAPDVQNLTVATAVPITLDPFESKTVTAKVYCAALYRKNPIGHKAKLTPFKLSASYDAFESQESVWNFQTPSRNDPAKKYTLTFYAWGSGAQTPGGESKFGHAFVDIPFIGVCGVSLTDRDGGYINNESTVISDHSRSVPYATHSCAVKISGIQLEDVKEKYWKWKTNPPHYTLGHNDCTSFVMDIADAAGIHYGTRMIIQTPIGFIDELARHNN